ncbi:MAG TPA: DUF4179 domain-containing protein [Bacillaceae bacterium]
MSEREGKLEVAFKQTYENISIPEDAINQAIETGYERAVRSEKPLRKRIKWTYCLVSAAIFLIGFFSGIRYSPAFADYVTAIPGMEKIVELVRHDKGLLLAVENEYYQEVGAADAKNGLKMTVDGVIADENALIIFYSIQSDKKLYRAMIEEAELLSQDGKKLDFATFSYGMPHESERGEKAFSGTIEYFFSSPFKARDFTLDAKLEGDGAMESFSIPFSIKKELQPKKVLEINKTISIERQKIGIKEAVFYPTRVALRVKMDPANTKKLLAFEDIRLVDERGETWGKITEGTTAALISSDEHILYFQSNYFKEPEHLFLVMERIQAVDKDEAVVVVDTEKERILKQPKEKKITDVRIMDNDILFSMPSGEDFSYFPWGAITDAAGREVEVLSTFSSGSGRDSTGINLMNVRENKSPLTIELNFYPAWIEGNRKVKIK